MFRINQACTLLAPVEKYLPQKKQKKKQHTTKTWPIFWGQFSAEGTRLDVSVDKNHEQF